MKLFILIIGLVSAELFAGGTVGNGGDGVVCPYDQDNKIQLLDFFELEGFKPAQIKGSGYPEVLEERLERLESYDERLSGILRAIYLELIESNSINFTNERLRDVVDESLGHQTVRRIFDSRCIAVQLALQSEQDGKVKISIDRDLFEQLNELNKAGLILHEVLYIHYKRTHPNLQVYKSREVRKLNRLIFQL